MSRLPADDPRRLQGVPRVRAVQRGGNHDDAEDAILFASSYRLIPDAWQADVVHAWMARRRAGKRERIGKWIHRRAGLAVPRQNGKNAALEIRELFGLVELGEAILHTAHQIKTSRKAFARLKTFFGDEADDPDAKFPELNALVAEVRNTNGQEAIFLKDLWRVDGQLVRSVGRPAEAVVEYVARGGFIEFATRTKKGGRGTTYDLLVVDEAQHLSEDDLEAIRPTISSGALGNSQVIYLGTPPNRDKLADGTGEAWVRIRSLANKAKDLAWIEYGAPDGPMPDLDDQVLLYACNPSLGVQHENGDFGLDFETVAGERDELSPAGYARERLGWWGDPATKHQGVINMQAWANLKVKVPPPKRAVLVLDVAANLEWTSIGAASAGPTPDETLVLLYHEPGTAWAADKVHEMTSTLDLVEVALTPNAKMLSADLTRLQVEHKLLSGTETRVGCSWFQERIKSGGIRHIGQPELDASVKNARTRYVAGVQDWDARDPRIDISPLRATSVAAQRWAEVTAKPAVVAAAPMALDLGPHTSYGDDTASPWDLDGLPPLDDLDF